MNSNNELGGVEMNPTEVGGELSPEAQAEKDAQIMEGLRARRAVEAAAEAALLEGANSKKEADLAQTRKNLEESHAWDSADQHRAGFN